MNRNQLLAAEMFGYSFADYAELLEEGDLRCELLMPQMAQTLEAALEGQWSLERTAQQLEIEPDRLDSVADLLEACRRGRSVVDAETPAEAFRQAMRLSITDGFEDMLDEQGVEALLSQICHRVSDLGFLLEQKQESLAQYSVDLRSEPDSEPYEED